MCCVAEAQAALIVRLSFRFRTKRRSGASSRSIRGRLSLTFVYIYHIYIYFIIYEYFISSVIYAVDFQCFPVQRMVPFVVSQPLCFAQCYHVTGEKWPWRTMLTWRSLSLPRSLPANTLCCSLRLKRLASFRQMEIAGWSKWCWYQGTLCLLDGCMKLVLRSTPELWTRWRRFAPKQECLRSASDEWRWRRLYHRSCRTAETAETTDYLLLCYMKSISTADSMMPVTMHEMLHLSRLTWEKPRKRPSTKRKDPILKECICRVCWTVLKCKEHSNSSWQWHR